MAATKNLEIDHRTIKLIIGIIAISLASLTSAFATTHEVASPVAVNG